MANKRRLHLFENDKELCEVRSIRLAKKMIDGLDLSMATVDADLCDYKIKDRGKTVFHRPSVVIP